MVFWFYHHTLPPAKYHHIYTNQLNVSEASEHKPTFWVKGCFFFAGALRRLRNLRRLKKRRKKKKGFFCGILLFEKAQHRLFSQVYLKGLCQIINWVRLSEWSRATFIYWCIYKFNFTYHFFESRKAETLRWKALFWGILVHLNVIFLLSVFFLFSSVKEKQNIWLTISKQTKGLLMYSLIFSNAYLPSEKHSWQLWSKIPSQCSLFIPFLTCLMCEE